MKFNLLILIFLCSNSVFSQLGFCAGSKGDAIFHEDFGSGTSSGPELPAGTTTYTYVIGDPDDGEYTISDQISQNISTFHSFLPKTTVSNGRALIVNASFTSGQFYMSQINGFCGNTTYEFSAFLMNVYDRANPRCLNGGIPINVRFQIWDETDSVLLKEGSTGDISSTNSPVYKQYALTFKTEPGQESVILKMSNNAGGGCGNDLAIDDIIFRSCGLQDEVLQICENGELQLDAGIENMQYEWSTGQTSQRITISEQGNFSVVITNGGCSVTKNFEINAVDVAKIEAIISEENTVIIRPANAGEFEYSLDGFTFQLSNTFQMVPGGVYTAFMRDLQSCNTVSEEFPHIVVPKFITPNNDGYNDRFELNGLEYFNSSEIRIFNRYGKLLIAGKGLNFSWDGTFNGKDLPGDDYWYEINIEDYKRIKGHFSLKR
jgi:gliding motility-associated-like protein